LKAANDLASFGLVAEPAVAPLKELLHDQNAALRLAAVRALGSIGPAARETIPDLLSLRESSDVTTRVLAAWALWKIDPETQEAVAAQMSVEAIGKGYYVTQSAISWLTEMGKEDLVMPALIKALKPENPLKRRVEVVMLIGTMGPKAKVAVQPLTEALFDASVGLRQCAAQTLGEIGPEARSALPALYKAVKQYPESAQVFGNAIRRIERREPLKLSGR
jgi:HEAT repeat protein